MAAYAGPLEKTGQVEIHADGQVFEYQTVQLKSASNAYRSSSYIEGFEGFEGFEGEEYAIGITAYENPQAGSDLNALIPVADAPSISLSAFLDASGLQTRGAEISWEMDPDDGGYWGSDAMKDDITLDLDSFDLDPEQGHFKAKFSGEVCPIGNPAISEGSSTCKHVAVTVDSDLSKLY